MHHRQRPSEEAAGDPFRPFRAANAWVGGATTGSLQKRKIATEAGGCRWIPVDAGGCRWMPVDAVVVVVGVVVVVVAAVVN